MLTLGNKGQSTQLQLGDKKQIIQAVMSWQSEVDLDLRVKYVPKGSKLIPGKAGGFLRKATPSKFETEGEIYSNLLPGGNLGSVHQSPFIQHMGDKGVGDTLDGDGNQEVVNIATLDAVDYVMFIANIFQKKGVSFAQFGGNVTVQVGDQKIEVPLTETKTGSWCVVALIDNTGAAPRLININEVLDELPTVGLVSELY